MTHKILSIFFDSPHKSDFPQIQCIRQPDAAEGHGQKITNGKPRPWEATDQGTVNIFLDIK